MSAEEEHRDVLMDVMIERAHEHWDRGEDHDCYRQDTCRRDPACPHYSTCRTVEDHDG